MFEQEDNLLGGKLYKVNWWERERQAQKQFAFFFSIYSIASPQVGNARQKWKEETEVCDS